METGRQCLLTTERVVAQHRRASALGLSSLPRTLSRISSSIAARRRSVLRVISRAGRDQQVKVFAHRRRPRLLLAVHQMTVTSTAHAARTASSQRFVALGAGAPSSRQPSSFLLATPADPPFTGPPCFACRSHHTDGSRRYQASVRESGCLARRGTSRYCGTLACPLASSFR